MLEKFCGQHKKRQGDKVAFGGSRAGGESSSDEDEGDEQAQGGGYMIRAVGVEGGDGGFRKGRGTLAKLAESETAKTVIIADWNGDMFLWGEFARKFNAFRTAVENQRGGQNHDPDFWVQNPVSRWEGEAALERVLILDAINDNPGCLTFEAIIKRMDLKYQQRLSDEAIEQPWSSLPLSGPEDHHLVQWWTTWNWMAEALKPDGSRYRAVFLNLVRKNHAAIISPQGCGNEDRNTILETEDARGDPFTAT